ncbi:single-stranded DNA-binding protein [Carbonactinospora thermoautotrophica]|uniref:single-stranded DNA-binding protein n=1 Tax=Carbonactinospora thermoautotrophica TaxID=1469144 RepID=UPI000830E405
MDVIVNMVRPDPLGSTPRVFDRAQSEWRDGEPLFLRCTVWRQYAEHVAESLTRGARVIVVGRLRQRVWDAPDGSKQTSFEVEVDEVGPALRWATAAVRKATRAGTAQPVPAGADEDWWLRSGGPAATSGGATSNEPPF